MLLWNKYQSPLLLVAIVLIALVLSACNMGSTLEGPAGSAETGGEMTITDEEAQEDAEAAAEDEMTVSDEEAEADRTVWEAANGDVPSCMVGTWAIDKGDFETYLEEQMSMGDIGATMEVTSLTGDLLVTLNEDHTMSISSEDFHVAMAMEAEGLSMDMGITYVASGTGNWGTVNGHVISWGAEAQIEGEKGIAIADMAGNDNPMDFMSEPDVTLELTPYSFFASASDEVLQTEPITEVGTPDSAVQATPFECSGDTVTYQYPDYGPISWNRVAG